MIYLEKIKILSTSNYPGSHVLMKNLEINCKSVNLFVGEQGSGKSTLLNMLFKKDNSIELQLSDQVKQTMPDGVNCFYFDSENDNPRIKNPQSYTTPSGTNKGIGIGNALASRFKSHGEIMEVFIINPLIKAKDSIIFLDEPESGLSIKNQFKLIKAIKLAEKNNNQLFIATHCYPLIQKNVVFSLDHNEFINGVDYINGRME